MATLSRKDRFLLALTKYVDARVFLQSDDPHVRARARSVSDEADRELSDELEALFPPTPGPTLSQRLDAIMAKGKDPK